LDLQLTEEAEESSTNGIIEGTKEAKKKPPHKGAAN